MAAPPSGVVTLLFTDVEGSTKLLRRLGERYADLLEDHRRLLRAAIARHGGYEFGAEGDALFAAFADARASLTRSPNSLGVAARNEGDLDRAKAYLEESLELRRAAGDHAGVAATLCDPGICAVDGGDLARGRALFEESLVIDRELGDASGVATDLDNLGQIALRQGDLHRAQTLLGEALRGFREIGEHEGVADALEQIAILAARRGRHERAAGVADAAAELRKAIGVPLPAVDRERLDHELADASAAHEGPSLSVEAAVLAALDEVAILD